MSHEGSAVGTLGLVLLAAVGMTAGLGCGERPPLDGDVAGTPAGQSTTTTTTTTNTSSDPADMQQLDADLLMRWNAAADTIATPGYDFHWRDFDEFPHPTYQLGTAEGYGDFSEVLLAFLQAGDNFDFMARNHLFGITLHDIFASGQDGLGMTFEALVDYFGSPTAFGNIKDSTRAAIAAYGDKIKHAS
jgi:hypothetical protein